MKLHFPKRDKLILVAGLLLLILFIIYAQFFTLMPLKTELTGKQETLAADEKILEVLSQKKGESLATIVENTRDLQKKVPVSPLQEQFILDLQKAETLSNSEIKSMGFTKDADVSIGDGNSQSTQTTESAGDGENAATENTETITGIKKITVKLNVESPGYEEFEKFIATLEALKRIVIVEEINYSSAMEITSLEQKSEPLDYFITVSAYYMPQLADLQSQLPKISSPEPANKDNPLSQFADPTKTSNAKVKE